MSDFSLNVRPGRKLTDKDVETLELVEKVKKLVPCDEPDSVYHPAHYREGTADMIDQIIDGLPAAKAAAMWNVFKYYERAGKKGDLAEDLAKANNYLFRAIYGKFRWEIEGGPDEPDRED